MVNIIGHVGCKAPIITGILKQIENRHCGIRKSVHEDGLQQTLRVVERPAGGGYSLGENKKFFEDSKDGQKLALPTYCTTGLYVTFDAPSSP